MQFFLDNLLSQTPDQQQTLAAIGEVYRIFNSRISQPYEILTSFGSYGYMLQKNMSNEVHLSRMISSLYIRFYEMDLEGKN